MNILNVIPADLMNRMVLSEQYCQRCNTELWLYVGEDLQEWDIEKCEYTVSRKGETMECHTCMKRESVLQGILAELTIANANASENTPDGMTHEQYRPKREKYEKMYELTKKAFEDHCVAWGFYADQIKNRYYELNKRISQFRVQS